MMQFFPPSLKITIPKHNIKRKKIFLFLFNHREKLCFSEFSARICWNKSLVVFGFFFLFTQSNKFYKFHWHILRKRLFIKWTERKIVALFSKFYSKFWIGFSFNTRKCLFLVVLFLNQQKKYRIFSKTVLGVIFKISIRQRNQQLCNNYRKFFKFPIL